MAAPVLPILIGLGVILLAAASGKKSGGGSAPAGSQPPKKVAPPLPTPGWGPDCPPGAADTEIASLPPAVRDAVNAALAAPDADPAALLVLATQLESCGLYKAGQQVRAKAGGPAVTPPPPPVVDPTPPPGNEVGDVAGGTGKKASSPTTQWVHTVKTPGENPIRFTALVFGDGDNARNPTTNLRRWVEFVMYNSPPSGSHATVPGSNPYNAYGTQNAAGKDIPYNFTSYSVGETFRVPPAWNQFIATDGTPFGKSTGGWPA